ncbi:MAG: hypothetical protein FWG48_03690 [Oscillospiraceae bacterium]|nr:hypothetical protein [Oscillospiraceae bacterium]
MSLMYWLIPLIFLLPPLALLLIGLAVRKPRGPAPGDAAAGDSSAEEDTEQEPGNEDTGTSADYYNAADENDDDAATAFGEDESAADAGGAPAADGETRDAQEEDEPVDEPLPADKNRNYLLIAAVIVLFAGIVIAASLYLGIKVTPWSSKPWWPW